MWHKIYDTKMSQIDTCAIVFSYFYIDGTGVLVDGPSIISHHK